MRNRYNKKRVSYLYRTAQPFTLASFLTWGSSTGAGRIRLTRCKSTKYSRYLTKRYSILLYCSIFVLLPLTKPLKIWNHGKQELLIKRIS